MKLINLFLLSCLLCSSVLCEASVCINNLYFNLNTSKLTASMCPPPSSNSDYSGNINIPSHVTYQNKTYTVTEIGYLCFGHSDVTSVRIPSTVTTIDINAFYACKNLKILEIPSSVTKINEAAFSSTTFTALTLRCKLSNYRLCFNSIGSNTIIYCLPSEIDAIKFYYKGTVYRIGYVPEEQHNGILYSYDDTKKTAKVIANENGYSGNITIPESVTSSEGITYKVTAVDANAFKDCTKLGKVILANSISTIGESAFNGSSVSDITLPTSLKLIDKSVFRNCKTLNKVVIPDNIINIREYAFNNSSIRDITLSLNLTNIGSHAFASCSSLNEIIFPESLTSIGDYSFYNSAVARIKFTSALSIIPQGAFSNCSKLTDVYLSKGVKTLKSNAFSNCPALRIVRLSTSVSNIDVRAFYGSKNIERFEVDEGGWNYESDENGILYSWGKNTLIKYPTGKKTAKVIIPENVQAIAEMAFELARGPFTVYCPQSLRRIGNGAFQSSELSDIYIPYGLSSIGDQAFMACKNLSKLIIPAGVTQLGYSLFVENTPMKTLVLLCNIPDNSSALSGLSTECVIYTPTPQVENVKKIFNGTVYPIGAWPELTDVISYMNGLEFRLSKNAEEKPESLKIYGNGTVIKPNKSGLYSINNLDWNTTYDVVGSFSLSLLSDKYDILLGKITTSAPSVNGTLVNATQTTLSLQVLATSDKTCKLNEIGIYFNEKYYPADKEGIVTLTGLNPGVTYWPTAYAKYGDKEITNSFMANTNPMNLTVTATSISPTTISCTGSYTAQDARVSESGFLKNESDGHHLFLSGLVPNNSYTVTFYVRTSNGGYLTKNYTFTTPKVTIETKETKIVKQGTAIVCAKTNLDDRDEQINVGFEWRKLDAPDIIPSKTGSAVLYNGVMEGYIRNLDPTSFYKVRPYFINVDENPYYGDWTGFDPSEFSYFEATVHTYANIQVGQGQATLRGYALSGTDDIIEQGFEYWQLRQAISAPRHLVPTTGVTVVKASGQRMEALINGLADNTVYVFRAYAKTVSKTIYGEEVEFTTPLPDAIQRIVESSQPKTKQHGIYNLSGQRVGEDSSSLRHLPRGLYIVNGSKIMVK